MSRVRQVLVCALALVLVFVCALTGCSEAPQAADGRLKVVCTTFASYDWVREITGERDALSVTLLLDDGVDLHSFESTVSDLATVAEADLFVYVGGESDAWVADALANATNQNQRSLSLMEAAAGLVREEEAVEGMQEEQEEGLEEDEVEYDEHVWLSLACARTLVNALAEELSLLDPEGQAIYEENARAYEGDLAELDGQYRELVAASPRDTVLFGDRFPFRYLMDDYGISYFAAFQGCSAETEASFETIAFLADKADELDLAYLLVCEDSDEKLAQSIAQAARTARPQVLRMDSLQSTSLADAQAGRTYLLAMRENLDTLAQALS